MKMDRPWKLVFSCAAASVAVVAGCSATGAGRDDDGAPALDRERTGNVAQPLSTAGFGKREKRQFSIPMSVTDDVVVGFFDQDLRADYVRPQSIDAFNFLSRDIPAYRQNEYLYPFGLNFGQSFPIPSWPTVGADFTGDLRTDFLRLGGTGAWLFYRTDTFPFVASKFQAYAGLDFGDVSMWQNIVGDFNGDAKADYARLGATGAWIFYGNGDGTFQQVFQNYDGLDFGLDREWDVVAGDFNGDHRTDYARLGSTGAWIYFGNANKTFTRTFQDYGGLAFGYNAPPYYSGSWKTITGDFDGDGKKDYARVGATGAWLFYGNASGTFSRGFHDFQGLNFGIEDPFYSSWHTIVGDFNGDGKTDYARLGRTGAFVFYATSNRGFSPQFQEYAEPFDDSIYVNIVGDFNGDGRADYARLGATTEVRFIHD